MSNERRYHEHEIAAIFEKAAEAQETVHRRLSPSEGLTLTELQEIGKEVGIAPGLIARAAAVIDRTEPIPPPTTFLGLPISLTRVIDLPEPLSDGDWDRLVVDLREAFQAPGVVHRDGSLRQWQNGNLYALVEPTESGDRLRMGSLNGSARSILSAGIAAFAMGVVFMLIMATSGKFAVNPDTLLVAMFIAMGLGGIGVATYRLPRWVEKRGRQMEAVAGRTVARLEKQPAAYEDEQTPSPLLDPATTADLADDPPLRTPGKTRS